MAKGRLRYNVHPRMRLVAITVLISALCAACHAQRFRFTPLKESIVEEREQQAPATAQEREAKIKQLFLQAGCSSDKIIEQSLAAVAGHNVVCRLPGKSQETIIVGANYGQAELDNWSAVSLLPSLFQSLTNRKRHHTFLFVAFADGGRVLAGSQFFAGQMSDAEVNRTEAMVNLDALGFSPTKISPGGSDKKLVESFITVMYALRIMGSQVDVGGAVPLASEPFAARHIPQITIHSLTHDAVAGMQMADAQITALPAGDSQTPPAGTTDFAQHEIGFRSHHYYSSYRLISGYLAFLDETLKPRQHKMNQ